MFQDSLVESAGNLKTKSSRWMLVTAAINCIIVGVMILVPLLYPEALPRTSLSAALFLPPPPPPPHIARATEPVARQMNNTPRIDPFTAPAHVPSRVAEVHEDPPPPDSLGISMATNGNANALFPSLAAGPPARPVAVKPAGPARISSGVMAGQLLTRTQPAYPAIARAAHISGAVVLHAVIAKDGSITSLQVISGPEMLRASAIDAVRSWRYKPYLLNGEPTEVDTTVTVNFTFG